MNPHFRQWLTLDQTGPLPGGAVLENVCAKKSKNDQSTMEEKIMGMFIKELWAFLRIRKKLWITPIIGLMVVIFTLLMVAESSVVAPFIYSLF
jgi:hypothetical protein